MLKFDVNPLFIDDLHDDFVMNEELSLFNFINKDPITAFYLGINIREWWDELDKKQKYLHSKLLRHNDENIQKYTEQISYWSKLFPSENDEEVDLIEMASYIFNNIIWDDSTIVEDQVRIALFLGEIVGKNMKEPEENNEKMKVK